MNRSMPPGNINPELAYRNVGEAVEWLCRAFGFTERLRIGDHRAQLVYGEGALFVTRNMSPDIIQPAEASHAVMVRVDDVDAHYQTAVANEARIISPPSDYPYGERQYVVEDVGGHRWTFSQTIFDADPADWGGRLV